MRCVYCHDRLTDNWIELKHGELAHTECALVIWARGREIVEGGHEVETYELSDEEARRMIHNWESELGCG